MRGVRILGGEFDVNLAVFVFLLLEVPAHPWPPLSHRLDHRLRLDPRVHRGDASHHQLATVLVTISSFPTEITLMKCWPQPQVWVKRRG